MIHFIQKLICIAIPFMAITISAADQTQQVKILFTSDLHGNFFPYDFIKMEEASGSYARIATVVDSIRGSLGSDNVLLLDNGDILQGQPTAYYYNFIDTVIPHLAAEIFNYMKVDAATIGNHDIETGHAVYDRWIRLCEAPILAANAIDTKTNKPYFQPYAVFNRGGYRIAVLGLISPAIPAWLPENLWSGMRFEPMEETAAKWIEIIRKNESPDVIIGLFHSGRDASKTTAGYIENASITTAENVDGFDAILIGHDHSLFCETIINKNGNKVHVVNPANNGLNLGALTITDKNGSISISSEIIDVSKIKPSEEFLENFSMQRKNVYEFVSEKIAEIKDTIYTRDAFFGPSEFMTLLHELQLEISGADISMAAPLTFDGMITKGDVKISDMFTLYKYENMLSTLKLTGQEIKDYLEFSYSLWIQQISEDSGHLIKYAAENPSHQNNKLLNPSYNFDSAAGINYVVDATKPYGEKIRITTLSSGEEFKLDSIYTVAVNSYRAGGGGNHLSEGARIPSNELKDRIVYSTDQDLRYYLIKILSAKKVINPTIESNWKFIPERIVTPLIKTDKEILFGKKSSRNQK